MSLVDHVIVCPSWILADSGVERKTYPVEALLEKLGESRWEENDKSFHVGTWPAGMAVHIRKESTWNIAWEMNAFLYISICLDATMANINIAMALTSHSH